MKKIDIDRLFSFFAILFACAVWLFGLAQKGRNPWADCLSWGGSDPVEHGFLFLFPF